MAWVAPVIGGAMSLAGSLFGGGDDERPQAPQQLYPPGYGRSLKGYRKMWDSVMPRLGQNYQPTAEEQQYMDTLKGWGNWAKNYTNKYWNPDALTQSIRQRYQNVYRPQYEANTEPWMKEAFSGPGYYGSGMQNALARGRQELGWKEEDEVQKAWEQEYMSQQNALRTLMGMEPDKMREAGELARSWSLPELNPAWAAAQSLTGQQPVATYYTPGQQTNPYANLSTIGGSILGRALTGQSGQAFTDWLSSFFNSSGGGGYPVGTEGYTPWQGYDESEYAYPEYNTDDYYSGWADYI